MSGRNCVRGYSFCCQGVDRFRSSSAPDRSVFHRDRYHHVHGICGKMTFLDPAFFLLPFFLSPHLFQPPAGLAHGEDRVGIEILGKLR